MLAPSRNDGWLPIEPLRAGERKATPRPPSPTLLAAGLTQRPLAAKTIKAALGSRPVAVGHLRNSQTAVPPCRGVLPSPAQLSPTIPTVFPAVMTSARRAAAGAWSVAGDRTHVQHTCNTWQLRESLPCGARAPAMARCRGWQLESGECIERVEAGVDTCQTARWWRFKGGVAWSASSRSGSSKRNRRSCSRTSTGRNASVNASSNSSSSSPNSC